MLRYFVIGALVSCSAGAAPSALQSWPAWKIKYDEAVAGKSAVDVKVVNAAIGGSDAPSNAKLQVLWSWLSQVPAGTEKTAAQSRMSKALSDAGGEASVLADFASEVATQYAGHAGKPDDAYNSVYKVITQKAAPTSGTTMYNLHQYYHSMSSDQQTAAARSLERGLGVAWDKDWANFDLFTGTYAKRTEAVAKIIQKTDPKVTQGAGKGDKCQKAYLAAQTAGDKHIMHFFQARMAAALKGDVATIS